MFRMTPFLVMTADKAHSRDRDPAVNEQRIEEPIVPYFPIDAYFKQNKHWQNILYDRNDRPQLGRQYGIQYVCKERTYIVYPGRDNEEC